MDSFTAFLSPASSPDGTEGEPLSPALLHAVGSGTWSVIQHELRAGRRRRCPELAPELVRIVLTPFAMR